MLTFTNNLLDGLARPHLWLFGRRWQSFQVCGIAGLIAAAVLAFILTRRLGLSLVVVGCLLLSGIATFLAVAMVTKILTGCEALTYYHHELAILFVSATGLRLFGYPLLPYLDIVILGTGTILGFGRIGCLMAGCCHGSPSRLGVQYGRAYSVDFPEWLLGVRVFPTQPIEAFLVFSIVAIGACLLTRPHAPGAALAWYVTVYGAVRFFLEFLRGDNDRPYCAGVSEAQWISLICVSVILTTQPSWLAGTAVASTAAASLWRITHRHSLTIWDYAPRTKEIAVILTMLARQSGAQPGIQVERTSFGLQISAGHISSLTGDIIHYAISRRDPILDMRTAQRIARLILRLKREDRPGELVTCSGDVYHLLVGRPEKEPEPADVVGSTAPASTVWHFPI